MLEQYYNLSDPRGGFPTIMIGVVMNVNDPMQMGRVQVSIPSMSHHVGVVNDNKMLPWASYASPYGGADQVSYRGPGLDGQDETGYGDKTDGSVAYGMWAIPKVGSRVLICAVDDDPNQLYWFGCIYPNSTPHTMPHGRYSTRTPGGENGPDGPLSSKESPINPLYENLQKAFQGVNNYEWRSRGADYQVSAVTKRRVDLNNQDDMAVSSSIHDDQKQSIIGDDGNEVGQDLQYRQGYSVSRSNPTKQTDSDQDIELGRDTDKNLESSTVSITTPGFHAIAMDDRAENCRMRFRTSTGHQIIMDDTNERIYVSTSEGRNWIEMDSDGHIYVYSEESISFAAEGDINLNAGKSVRIKGEEGVHIQTPKQLRIHAVDDIHIRGEKNVYAHVTETTQLHSEKDVHVLSESDAHFHVNNLRIKTDANMHSEVGTEFTVSATNIKIDDPGTQWLKADFHVAGNAKVDGDTDVKSLKAQNNVSGADCVSASQSLESLNGHTHGYKQHVSGTGEVPKTSDPFGQGGSAAPGASPNATDVASAAVDAADAELAFWTNIVPQHEPWARTFMAEFEENLEHTPELEYDDPSVGQSMKKVKDTERKRGPLWRR